MIALCVALGCVGVTVGPAGAEIVVARNTDATQLVNTLLGTGTGGITVTNSTLSFNQNTTTGAQSSGIYMVTGPNHYNLPTGSGIVLSSGDVADAKSGPVIPSVTTGYGVPATSDQFNLLKQVSPASSAFNDVTELTITFTAGPNTNNVFFNGVFASAEYPHFVGAFIDGFGLFLNGKNIAVADGQPVNIDSPDMVNTNFAKDPLGNPGDQYQETAYQGLLVQKNGNPVITFSGAVTPGSTGNTLTFIVGDANDDVLDTAIYLQGLGNAPPPTVPEPSSLLALTAGLFSCGLVQVCRLRRRNSGTLRRG
jgi:hypothetical protein